MTAQLNVNQELSVLPAKVRRPFECLLKVGQIDEATLEHVLRAGRRAGDVSKLLGFAVGYVFLRGKGVPVDDVIRMSEHLRRRVNLSWTERRWRDEHSRLSRAETLSRLAGKNVRYETSEYARHLPIEWPGYLIRSSRRLGMEGLKQRHCVASYHDQIQRNRCAIAVVFLDKQRWTVQLFLTNDADTPLRLGQIRTRNNVGAPAEVAEAVHDALGIKFTGHAALVSHEPVRRFYQENLRRVWPVLQELGIESVCVSFDGSGDSGSIWDVNVNPPLDGEERAVAILQSKREYDGKTRRWLQTEAVEQISLEEAISELTYDYLGATDVDWYNNDGGYGDLIMDVAAGTVELNVHQRFTESSCEYSAVLDIASGEEL